MSKYKKITIKITQRAEGGETVDFVEVVLKYRRDMKREGTNIGELSAFIAYCQAFPTGDTLAAIHCNTLTKTHCNTLQHTATHCNT